MNLNGSWRCFVDGGAEHTYSITGTVPGCVHTDLRAAGLLPDFHWRDNADVCQWVENCTVTYEKDFAVDAVRENTVLTFDGLDVYCSIYLNDTLLGEADDMFIPWSFSVDGILRPGTNTVKVVFCSPVREVEGLPKRGGAFTTERLYTRRIQCTYGWDWVARFVTMGIWRDVRLETLVPDRLDNVYVYTKNINPYSAQIGIRADYADITGGWTELSITSPDGNTVWHKKRRLLPTAKGADTTRITEIADIPSPMLWYPAGYGEQPLYTLTVVSGSGTKTVPFGIRTVVILETEDAPDSAEAEKARKIKQYDQLVEWDRNEGSSAFILLVNGVRIFCRGANWVPCEPFPSAETDEKLSSLVSLAKEGNYNMLRVWGGGIFEHDAFYSACDREGILVTQDFLMACGQYPEEDDAFIDHLKQEARAAALALRCHPCLVWWSGDNENAVSGDENKEHYNGRRAALEAIGPVLAELDPERRFLPSSPYGGVPYASGVRGTTHNTQFLGNFFGWVRKGDFSGYREYFEHYLARFTAEQPAIGMPYVSSLRRFLTDEDIFGDDTAMSEYHTKNNPGLGEITLYGYADRLARGIFGDYTSGQDRVKKMQLLQCEWIRLSLELFRRNMWFSSGIVYWMYNDCWRAANGWSMVDYDGCPKPSFYAFKRASQALIGSVTEEDGQYRVYLCNAGKDTFRGNLRLYRYNILTGAEETLVSGAFDSPAGCAEPYCSLNVSSVPLDAETVLLCDLTDGNTLLDRSYYLPLRWADMKWEDGEARVLSGDTSSKGAESVTFTSSVTLPVVLLDLPYRVSENGMFLKRGEVRTVRKAGNFRISE